MPHDYSPKARRSLLATSADTDLLVLLEIRHKDLPVPIRVLNDNVDFTVAVNEGGVAVDVTFVACAFDLTLPDDVDQQTSKATLSVSNIGRDLTQWLEYSNGGAGAKVRMLQTMRSDARLAWEFGEYAEGSEAAGYTQRVDINEWNPWEMDIEMDMSKIVINNLVVSSQLGYESAARMSAVAVRFDTISSPGLF